MRIARLICSLLLVPGLLAIPVQSRAQVAVGISVRIGPPVLPVYVQPICPEPGYIWVPGTWVFPPEVGLLWTPGYWGWEDGFYVWYPGYWGPEVGFYGGISYGFGYTGVGFFGGYWRGGAYYYNRAVTNVNVTVVRNTYNTTVINNNATLNRVSFNGGPGGITARPTSRETAAARQQHVSMTSEQTQHQQAAGTNRALLASVNHGRPNVAATPRPGEFKGHGEAAPGRGAHPQRPPENRRETSRPGSAPADRGRGYEDRPPSARPANAAPVNPRLEQKHQREMEKLRQQHDAERQKVERQHAQEQQRLDRQSPNQQRQEQLQRRQQQQREQMNQKHDQQAQKLQERQQREAQRQQEKEHKGGRPPGR